MGKVKKKLEKVWYFTLFKFYFEPFPNREYVVDGVKDVLKAFHLTSVVSLNKLLV